MKLKFFLPIILLFTINIVVAQTYSQLTKLVASDRASSDNFGRSVAISGEYAVVGVYSEDEDVDGNNTLSAAGSVYIYKINEGGTGNWGQIKKIVPSDRAAGDRFGFSVAISGDYIIVGASREDEDASNSNTLTDAGSAYVFKKDEGGSDNWGQIKKIVASDRGASDYFGEAVSISGDYIIVGASREDEDASGNNTLSNTGSAYIFQKDNGGTDNWGELQKIVASDRAAIDNFGRSVSISGDYAIVGAYQEDEDANGNNTVSIAGSAYIFQKDNGGTDNWGELQKIVASDRASNDYFGWSVSISGDYAVVGAYQEDEDADGNNNASKAGSAYIFYKDEGATDNWGEQKKIVPSDRASNDFFAYSVSISGDYVIVSSHQEDEDASGSNTLSNAGSAYIFSKDEGGSNNWGQLQKIAAANRKSSDFFGISVAASTDYMLVGAYFEDEDKSDANSISDAGSAYIFKSSAALPVELISFTGNVVNSGNLLYWQTASEQNNSGFEIQRSTDGKEWTTISFEVGNGTTEITNRYEYLDDYQEWSKGISGIFYRLKQIDFDGQYEYSKVIYLGVENLSLEVKTYPNPVRDQLHIINGQGQLTIYNLLGQPIYQLEISNEQFILDTSNLAVGQYIINIQQQNGSSFTQRLTK